MKMTNVKYTPGEEGFEAMRGINDLSDKLNKAAKETFESIKEFNKLSHSLFIDLARIGWHYNSAGSIGDIVKIKILLNANDIESINKLMIKQIKNDYKILKKQTLELFNTKKEILKRGFTAYEKKQYEYSILIFLTQTDSICKQLTGLRLFGRDQKQAKTKKFADKHFDETSIVSATLQPLADVGEINKDESAYIVGEFNRHKIIHGDETEYGTTINAHKMLSLIFYLSTLVSDTAKK